MELLRSFLKHLGRSFIPKPDGWTMFMLLLSLVAYLVAAQRGEAHPMNEAAKWAFPISVAIAVWVSAAVIKAATSALLEAEKERKDLRLELAHIKTKPHIDLQIYRVFILPLPGKAKCFLEVSLHNEAGPSVSNPPNTAYSMRLLIDGKPYDATRSIDPEKYEAATLRLVFDDYSEQQEYVRIPGDDEVLYRIYSKSEELVPGTRLYGWLGFEVLNLPAWPTRDEFIGTRVEYKYYDENGVPDEQSAYPKDEYSHVPLVSSVESIFLNVVDSYNTGWPKTKDGPFMQSRDGISQSVFLRPGFTDHD